MERSMENRRRQEDELRILLEQERASQQRIDDARREIQEATETLETAEGRSAPVEPYEEEDDDDTTVAAVPARRSATTPPRRGSGKWRNRALATVALGVLGLGLEETVRKSDLFTGKEKNPTGQADDRKRDGKKGGGETPDKGTSTNTPAPPPETNNQQEGQQPDNTNRPNTRTSGQGNTSNRENPPPQPTTPSNETLKPLETKPETPKDEERPPVLRRTPDQRPEAATEEQERKRREILEKMEAVDKERAATAETPPTSRNPYANSMGDGSGRSPYGSYGGAESKDPTPYTSYGVPRISPEILQQINNILKDHPEFRENNFHLPPEALIEIYKVYQRNIANAFGGTWEERKEMKVGKFLEDKNPDPNDRLAIHLKELHKMTKLELRRAETVKDYMARCYEWLAKHGKLDQAIIK
ncbi:MAG TPA: hypothetical protein VGO21_00470 [Candidatus Paceibacterota bacterium]|jgi:hypothetical protein|nr:hypothetical protein [Candidatus Paceibacterota bacterium]